MKSAVSLLFLTGLLLAAELQATSVYKCTNTKGFVEFSESPCSDNAEKIQVSAPIIGTEGSTNAKKILKSIEKNNRPREIDNEIKKLENQITEFQKSLDSELEALQDRKKYAANNLAGATWEGSISTEMQAVVDKYKTKISNARSQIEYLRTEKDRILTPE